MSDTKLTKRRVNISNFVRTHCRTCAAGQTITREEGGKATYCLLLRDWMTDQEGHGTISDCDRYEAREQPSES
jgi:hypothetical protein